MKGIHMMMNGYKRPEASVGYREVSARRQEAIELPKFLSVPAALAGLDRLGK
jgi:hypothetical protein